ncbi:uncharacterized protein LOC135120689 [Zophobas morio]|uniref:uncharacterized protein LOC135120689 n=1 Tax=Zophobas morio TaxID=2755281 RepID=UPI0030839A24
MTYNALKLHLKKNEKLLDALKRESEWQGLYKVIDPSHPNFVAFRGCAWKFESLTGHFRPNYRELSLNSFLTRGLYRHYKGLRPEGCVVLRQERKATALKNKNSSGQKRLFCEHCHVTFHSLHHFKTAEHVARANYAEVDAFWETVKASYVHQQNLRSVTASFENSHVMKSLENSSLYDYLENCTTNSPSNNNKYDNNADHSSCDEELESL